MTYKETYGNFENYQRYLCEVALKFWIPEKAQLELALAYANDYAVKHNLSRTEIINRYDRAMRAIYHAKEILRTGQEDPLYRMAWEKLKYKECY